MRVRTEGNAYDRYTILRNQLQIPTKTSFETEINILPQVISRYLQFWWYCCNMVVNDGEFFNFVKSQ